MTWVATSRTPSESVTRPVSVIFIRADKETIYGDFMGVMNKLQDNGFYSVALIGLDQRGRNGNS